MTPEPHLPRVGDVIDGKYRIDALIGEGGMGVVFAATHLQMDKRRALKWLLPKLARDPNAVRRFLAEARVASRIDHPNVVSPIDVSVDAGAPYIVMERLEGETLGEFLGDQSLPLDKAGRIFMPILQGVAAAHDQNVVHRDLKPGNIFLARSGEGGRIPKVLDFGIAKVIDGQQTQGTLTDHGAVLGTIQYMSPEQLQDASRVGPAADVYALGVILYRMLSGNLPYEGNLLDLALRIREGRPAPLRTHAAGLPEGLEDVVMRALAPSLEQRYADVRSFARALSPYFPHHGVDFGPALHPSRPDPISELPRSRPDSAGAQDGAPLPLASARDAAPEASAATGAGVARAAGKEISTFNPVATGSQSASVYRTWLAAGAALLFAFGIALALVFGPDDRDAAGDRSTTAAGGAAPAIPADPPHDALGRPLPPPADPRATPDGGQVGTAAPAAGWQDLGGDRPAPAAPAAAARPEPAGKPPAAAAPPQPASVANRPHATPPPGAPADPARKPKKPRAPSAPPPAQAPTRPQPPPDLGF